MFPVMDTKPSPCPPPLTSLRDPDEAPSLHAFPLGSDLDPVCAPPLCSQLLRKATYSGTWESKSLRTRWPRPLAGQPGDPQASSGCLRLHPEQCLAASYSLTPAQQQLRVNTVKTPMSCVPSGQALWCSRCGTPPTLHSTISQLPKVNVCSLVNLSSSLVSIVFLSKLPAQITPQNLSKKI